MKKRRPVDEWHDALKRDGIQHAGAEKGRLRDVERRPVAWELALSRLLDGQKRLRTASLVTVSNADLLETIGFNKVRFLLGVQQLADDPDGA